MKVLLAISSYGTNQQQYLHRILDEYNNMPYNIDCYIYTTQNNNTDKYKNLNITQIINPLSIGEGNAWAHRKLFKENKDKYDLYIYTENDHLLTQTNIETYLSLTNELPDNKMISFLQYELKSNNDTKYSIVLIKGQQNRRERAFIVDTDIVINDKHYFEIQNKHCGLYILTNKQLNHIISNNRYEESYRVGSPYGNMETLCLSGLDLYHKIISYDELDNLLVHHLPNKYINSVSKYTQYGTLSIDELKQYKNKNLKEVFL